MANPFYGQPMDQRHPSQMVEQAVLFVVFMILVFTMERGFMTIFGAVHLLSLGLAFGVTNRLRDTVEATV